MNVSTPTPAPPALDDRPEAVRAAGARRTAGRFRVATPLHARPAPRVPGSPGILPTPGMRAAPGAARGTLEHTVGVLLAVSVVLQPALHPNGPGNSSPVDLAVLAVIAVAAVWVVTDRVRILAPYLFAVAVMVLAGFAAALVGPMTGSAAVAVAQDVVLVVYAAAAATACRRPGRVQVMLRAWAVSASLYAGVVVVASWFSFTPVTGVIAREGNRVLFTFGDPNYAGAYWVLSIFVVCAARAPDRPWLRRLAIVALLWATVLTESNGAVVELAVGCGFLLAHAAWRHRGRRGALAVTCLLLFAAVGVVQVLPTAQTWALASGQPLLVNSLGRSNESSAQRSQLITEMFDLYREHGVLGYGAGTTKSLLVAEHYPYAKEAHDDYLASLVERGPLGLIGVAVLVLGVAWRSRSLLRAPPAAVAAAGVPRPAALVAGLLGMSVAATFYEVLHFRFLWLAMAFVAALATTATDRARPADVVGGRR